jgi:hypothetical protein
MSEEQQMQLPLPCDLPQEYRFAEHADGTPAVRVCVILDEVAAGELNAWLAKRTAELKARNWQGWGIAESVVRTLCVQIDSFGRQAFGGKGGQA